MELGTRGVIVGWVLASWVSHGLAQECPCPGEDTVVIGHRGTGGDVDGNPFPENTLASFQEAVREGATMVELDVQLSQDGVLVVMHDDTVDRTTDGSGCVAELDAAALGMLRAGGEPVPTLEEVFAAVDVDLNVEIKVADEGGRCPGTDRTALAAELARVLGAHAGERAIVVSSFDLAQLQAVREADPEVRLALLFIARGDFATAAAEGMDAHPFVLSAQRAEVEAHRAAGLAVRPYTVNDAATMERLLRLDVDGIVTDEPALLVETKARVCEAHVCAMDAGPDAGAGADGGSSDTGGGSGGCAAAGGAGSGALVVWLVLLCIRRTSG